MKRFLHIITMIVALAAAYGITGAAATTVTWTFSQGTANGYINMSNYQNYFPNGMILSSTDNWGWYSEDGQGVDGARCLRSGSNYIKSDNLIVFYARKGTVTFNIKGRFASPTLVVWTATEEGGNYQLGTELLNRELSEVSTSEFTPISIDIENDGYVAFTATAAYINDISNTYEETTAATTDTWIFSQGTANGYINMSNYQNYFPNGMILSSTDNWGWYSEDGQGVDGARCLRSGSNYIKSDNLIVFYAHKGTVTFNIKGRFASPTLVVWTATEEGGSYQLGTELLNRELSEVSTSEFTPISIDIENDGYVAFTATAAYINDISNTYEKSAATYSVSGTVKDADGTPIEGATVALLSTSVQTDAEGAFTIAGIADGEYDIAVSKDGYKIASAKVAVGGADVSGVEVTLEKTITIVKGIVMDMMNYEQIVGEASVTFMTPESEVVAEAVMDGANYSVTLEGTVLPSYKVKVSPRYYSEVTYDYSVWKPGEENTRNWIVNYKKISFSLSLKDADGQPLSGATVTLEKAGGDTSLEAAENAAEPGTYFIGNMNAHVYADDTYVIRVAMPDYTAPEPIEISFDGESYAGELTLERMAPTVISGAVTDEEGSPVAAATVMLSDGSPIPIQTVTTGDDGLYSINIDGEPAESYMLIVYADYYESAAVTLTDIAASQTNTADVTLATVKYTFTATVKDEETDMPLADAVVKVSDGENVVETAGDGEGNYTCTVTARMSFGKTYTVSVEAEGYHPAEAYSFAFEGQDTSAEIALAPVKYTFTATVKDEETDMALTNAVVKVSDGENVVEAAGDGEGNYTCAVTARMSSGKTYTVSVEAEGYHPAEAYSFAFEGQDVSRLFPLVKINDSVSGAIIDDKAETGIYTLTGIRVNAKSTGSLPAGIYVIGGRKVLVK